MAMDAVLAFRHPGERRDPALLTSAAVPRQIKMDSSFCWNDEGEGAPSSLSSSGGRMAMDAVLALRHPGERRDPALLTSVGPESDQDGFQLSLE
jgi:hypothetical protein